MNTHSSLFVFAGEPSGDLHGSHLLKALKLQSPSLNVIGVGGPKMREQGITSLLQMEDFEVMGLTDVLKNLPKLWKQFRIVLNYILTVNPQAVLLIDYPGFNLRLAKALRKKGYKGKIAHYIAPTIWAHSQNRIEHMAKTLDLLMIIFPFEKDCFSATDLPVVYVGNPLTEYLQNYSYQEDWRSTAGLDISLPIISLFPGSRAGEIYRNLPEMLAAASKLQQEYPELQFAISCTNIITQKIIQSLLHSVNLQKAYAVSSQYNYEMMRDSSAAIAKSGTVTLELALHECPSVAVYKLGFLNWLYAKFVLGLKLSSYCIVNIIKGQIVFPELIEHGFSAQNIYLKAKELYTAGSEREACLYACRQVKEILYGNKASEKAAEQIKELLC
jgi:lipid-A-disaccharide synthase